jgi:hypothetical protein
MPEDLDLAQKLAKRLGDAGRGDDRRALLGELAAKFAEEGRYKELESAAMELAEHDDWEGLLHVADALPTLAGKGAFKECAGIAGVTLEGLAKCGRAGQALDAMRRVVSIAVTTQGEDGAEPFRGAVIDSMKQGPGKDVPGLDDAVVQSGLSGDTPLAKAIEAFDTIASLAPGRGVLHDGFGPGRIVSNDTVTIVVDFMKSKGHKMPYVAARRTLTAVSEDDIRLMRHTNPAEVTRMRTEDQASLIVGALAWAARRMPTG